MDVLTQITELGWALDPSLTTTDGTYQTAAEIARAYGFPRMACQIQALEGRRALPVPPKERGGLMAARAAENEGSGDGARVQQQETAVHTSGRGRGGGRAGGRGRGGKGKAGPIPPNPQSDIARNSKPDAAQAGQTPVLVDDIAPYGVTAAVKPHEADDVTRSVASSIL